MMILMMVVVVVDRDLGMEVSHASPFSRLTDGMAFWTLHQSRYIVDSKIVSATPTTYNMFSFRGLGSSDYISL